MADSRRAGVLGFMLQASGLKLYDTVIQRIVLWGVFTVKSEMAKLGGARAQGRDDVERARRSPWRSRTASQQA